MELVERWVLTSGQRMLLIYGANDPWSATAFDVQSQNDSYRLFATGRAGDHLAGIFDLADDEFFFVADKLDRWLLEGASNKELQRAKKSERKFARPTKAQVFYAVTRAG